MTTRPSTWRPLAEALAVVLVLSGAASAEAQSLYWVDTQFGAPAIHRADGDGNSVATLPQPAGSLLEGVAVDGGGRVYWTEAAWANARLGRAAFDLSNPAALVTGGSVFRGLAVDPVDLCLYWTSSNLATGSRVHRADPGGAGATSLITLGPGANPRGIAVDHAAGKLYWADFDQSVLYRANLDGTSSTPWLPLASGSGPFGVAVDPAAQHVYWTEYNTGLLRRVRTDATDLVTVMSGLSQPTYLALDLTGGRMFWSEAGVGGQKIRRATLGGASVVTLPAAISAYGGLAYWPGGQTPVADVPVVEFGLDVPWPSPSRGAVHVGFSLPREARTSLRVFDLQGREVAVLVDGIVEAGRHQRSWNGPDAGSSAPGVYFVRLAIEGRTWLRRLVVTR